MRPKGLKVEINLRGQYHEISCPQVFLLTTFPTLKEDMPEINYQICKMFMELCVFIIEFPIYPPLGSQLKLGNKKSHY